MLTQGLNTRGGGLTQGLNARVSALLLRVLGFALEEVVVLDSGVDFIVFTPVSRVAVPDSSTHHKKA